MAATKGQVEELERQALELQSGIEQTAAAAREMLALKRVTESLELQAGQVRVEHLCHVLSALENDLQRLRHDLTATPAIPVSEPELVDLRWVLPAAPARGYAKRSLSSVQLIVVEHSATIEDISPERLASAHLEQGKPAIACHFLVGRDGTIYWTHPFEAVVSHTLDREINGASIAVCLAGNFSGEAPGEMQLEATAALLAWLVSVFGLGPKAIRGRRELEDVSSPGAQWLRGANYKAALLGLVHERLNGHSGREMLPVRGPGPLETRAARRVPRPEIVNVVSSLPKHPTLAPYPNRTVPITTVAIHHTDSRKTTTVQQLAQYHVYGVRKDAKGNVVKAQWPGIGYHFVIAADGTIYQCQREQTQSYHVGGNNNPSCLGVSFIGRFMRFGYDGKLQREEDQIPTPAQLSSGGQLVAWLMQEFTIAPEKVMGHKDVVGGATACPGEHWEAGLKWRSLLQEQIQAAFDAAQVPEGNQPLEHYLLFWDRGTSWAATDWQNAQEYIARFRPTTGFSVQDALQARHVTIVGGTRGVSEADEARLRAQGVQAHRLDGATEAATKALLDALVAENTPWPGAMPRVVAAASKAEPSNAEDVGDGEVHELEPDEWTVPEDWQQLLAPAGTS